MLFRSSSLPVQIEQGEAWPTGLFALKDCTCQPVNDGLTLADTSFVLLDLPQPILPTNKGLHNDQKGGQILQFDRLGLHRVSIVLPVVVPVLERFTVHLRIENTGNQ